MAFAEKFDLGSNHLDLWRQGATAFANPKNTSDPVEGSDPPAARFSMAKGSVTGIRLSARPNPYEGQQGQLLRSSVIDWRLRPLLSASFSTTSVLAPHRNARARTV